MNCIVPGLNLKVLAKTLQALAKVGDELYLEARKDKLTLVALNIRKTICVRYHLLDSFFSSYEVNEDEFNEKCEAITCKIHMKVLLPLFKGANLEKKFDFTKIEYENNSDLIVFKMKYKCDDILMTNKLRLMDTESLTIEISPDSGCNNMLAASSFFNQLLTMFSNSDDEITLEISRDKLIARNYIVGTPMRPKCVRSQVNLNTSEFNVFQIDTETTINFSLRPLRTAIQFAEGFNLNIGLNFETGGKPLAIIMKNPSFEVNFIIATLNPYSDLQSSMATTSIPTKITQRLNDIGNISVEDQQALQNENWDEFMANETVETKSSNKKVKKTSFEEIMEKAKQKNQKHNKEKVDKDVKIMSKTSNKKFNLPLETCLMQVSPEYENMDMDVLPPSPESPRTKRAKLVFGRCFEPTFSEDFGDVLAPNSDSD